MTDTLTCAIVGHLVGDYLLQNDWMANTKKRPGHEGRMACLSHSGLWAASVCLFAGWGEMFWLAESPAFAVLWFLHYWQDRTNVIAWWMRLKWKDQSRFMETDKIAYYGEGPEVKVGLGPWSVIVVDNVWHIVTIWAVWKFLT